MKQPIVRIAFICGTFWLCSVAVAFAMESTNFKIMWDSLNVGGDDISSSTNYKLRDTIGEMGTGTSTDGTYALSAGYRVGDGTDSFLSFTIGTQVNSSRVGWTLFSLAGKSVTVASDPGYAVGDFIAVVENQGGTQIVAVGKITSIAGTTFNVDAWDGNSSLISPIAAGADDYVYRLTGTTADLGQQSVLLVSTSITRTSVFTNATSGYAVRVIADGALRSGAYNITNVSDGAVTTSTEEYGSQVMGSLGVSTSTDLAISSTSTRTIQLSTATSTDDRVAFIYKLAISSSTQEGTYSQTVSFMTTANY